MLYFNSNKFDFWKIYDAVKQFYPLGVNKDIIEFYLSYPGLKELEKIVVDTIHNGNNDAKLWSSLTEDIEKEIGKEIIGTTYGQAPSFSSYVLLDSVTTGNLTRTKELYFFVSLLGPFYTIIGRYNNTVKFEDGKHFTSTNYLVVSPEDEFADTFKFLCDKIETSFKGYRFIPFGICRQSIDGIHVRYSDKNLNTFFHALFNDQIDITIPRQLGDSYFKSNEWIKEDYVDSVDKWTAYPPSL